MGLLGVSPLWNLFWYKTTGEGTNSNSSFQGGDPVKWGGEKTAQSLTVSSYPIPTDNLILPWGGKELKTRRGKRSPREELVVKASPNKHTEEEKGGQLLSSLEGEGGGRPKK